MNIGVFISFIFCQSILIINSATVEEVQQVFVITSSNNQVQDSSNANTIPTVAGLDSVFVNADNQTLSTFDQFKLNSMLTSSDSADAANLGKIAGDVVSTLVDIGSSKQKLAVQVPDEFCPFKNMTPPCDIKELYRRADGGCNNLKNPFLGSANTPYIRILKANYDDGVRVLRAKSKNGSSLPNARLISINMCTFNNLYLDNLRTNFFALFGQFLTHDMTASAPGMDKDGNFIECDCPFPNDDCITIPIPSTDTLNRDQRCMSTSRTSASVSNACNLGVRQQLNVITHTVDLSTIYGSSQDIQNFLRSFKNGTLRVLTGVGSKEYLPPSPLGSCTADSQKQPCFTSGDSRVNENLILSSFHTLFTREHNRIAKQLQSLNPLWNDEKVFQESRKINIAMFQHIIYNEYLPTLIGPSMTSDFSILPLESGSFTDYDDSFKPSVINEFAAAAFRLHTLIRSDYLRLTPDTRRSDKVHLSSQFFCATEAWNTARGGLSSILTGSTQQNALLFDNCMNPTLRDHLFEFGNSRFDLNAINIMRGRDHGLDTYAAYLRWIDGDLKAPAFTSFKNFTNIDPKVQDKLASLYASPEDVDLHVGCLSERPLPDAAVGPTAATIIALQFSNLKIADRFYYETGDQPHSFTPEQLDSIRSVSFARILCDNADSVFRMQRSVFLMANFTTNPIVLCSDIPELDLSLWLDV